MSETVLPQIKSKPFITIEQLRIIVPTLSKNADVFIPYLNDTMKLYEITTPARIASFIAQVAEESGGFKFTQEIADGREYEGREDLGNIHAGDGKKFKGRGLIECTGRANYIACSLALFKDAKVLITTPQLLETPQYAVASAGWFWNKKGLNRYADLPAAWRSRTKKFTPFQYITFLINGGLNGYAQRLAYYERARKLFLVG